MYCNPCQVASSDSLASVMNSVDQAQTLVTTSLKVLQDPWLLSVSLRFWSVSVEMIRISSHPKSLLDLSDLDFRDLPPNYRQWWHDQCRRDRGPATGTASMMHWSSNAEARLVHRDAFGDMEPARPPYGTDLPTTKNTWRYHKRS